MLQDRCYSEVALAGLSLELPHVVDSTMCKRETLRRAAIPTKWNCPGLCVKKLSKDHMHFLMNMAGVYDSKVEELVGTSSMAREIYSEEFKGALGAIPVVCGIGRATKT